MNGLIEYGFSEKQAKVYIAALKLWAAPGWTIARQSWIQRATAYAILNDFIREWVVRKITRKWLMYFSVVEPEGLLYVLEDKIWKFKTLVPMLKWISESIWSKPQIQYLEWLEWLKQMFSDFTTTDTEDSMRAILWNMKYNNDKLMAASTDYRNFREKTWMVFKRIITYHNADPVKEKQEDKLFNRQTCIVQDMPFDIRADISIYWPGKCAIIFFDDAQSPHIILIKSKEVYELMRGLFEYIWTKENMWSTPIKTTKSIKKSTPKKKIAIKKKK